MSLATTIPASSRLADRRWWALVLLAMADFVVILESTGNKYPQPDSRPRT